MKCIVCGQPVPPELSDVGLCGPCCTGEADYYGDDEGPDWAPGQCCGMIRKGKRHCPQDATVQRDGKGYCHQHDPLGKHQRNNKPPVSPTPNTPGGAS